MRSEQFAVLVIEVLFAFICILVVLSLKSNTFGTTERCNEYPLYEYQTFFLQPPTKPDV